jgi:hypothetical protein
MIAKRIMLTVPKADHAAGTSEVLMLYAVGDVERDPDVEEGNSSEGS